METETKTKDDIYKRVMEVVSDVYHPLTGAVCLTEETIKSALSHKTIGRYAYVLHDKDTYTKADAEAYNKSHSVEDGYKEVHEGDLKPAHWHVVMEAGNHNSFKLSSVAKWFGVPEKFVQFGKNRTYNEFLDRVGYLTHEDPKQQDLGKHRYEDDEIKANFDFRAELNVREERRAKYGRDINDEEAIGFKVMYEGMTIRQAITENPAYYKDHYRDIEGWRGQYLSNVAKMPPYRINFYISGPSHSGKTFLSESLARLLVDPEHNLSDDEIFFHASKEGARFEKYDGQPVIIWDDCRSADLVNSLGGYSQLYSLFDTHPTNQRVNVKYGSTKLINAITIVNGQESWDDFLKGCRKSDEDPVQVNRRFPFFFVLHDDDYDFGVLNAYVEDYGSFNEYVLTKHIQGSFGRIAEKFNDSIERVNTMNDKAIAPVKPKIDEGIKRLGVETVDDKEYEEYYKSLGSLDKATVEKVYPRC